MNYAKALRVLRAAKGIDQQDLAKRAGISKSLLSKIESEQRELTIDNRDRIAAALRIPSSLIDVLALESKDNGVDSKKLKHIGETLLNMSSDIEGIHEKNLP